MGSKPTEILIDGTKIWRNERGEIHREDGPAVIRSNGSQEWWLNGKIHREDGPAVVRFSGHFEWWINNHEVTTFIAEWATERDIDLDNLSEEDKMIIQLEWGNYGK